MRISDWSSDVCSSDLSWALTDTYEWGGVELGQGFPEWTELGQDSGLDPLGMQRPLAVIYQSLVPGISTITLPYRYYSFFTFLLRHYDHNLRTRKSVVWGKSVAVCVDMGGGHFVQAEDGIRCAH